MCSMPKSGCSGSSVRNALLAEPRTNSAIDSPTMTISAGAAQALAG